MKLPRGFSVPLLTLLLFIFTLVLDRYWLINECTTVRDGWSMEKSREEQGNNMDDKEMTSMEDEMLEVRARLLGPLSADDPLVLSALKKFYLNPPPDLPYNLKTGKAILVDDSWHFIDQHVQKLFTNEPPGFFIEAGAVDGERVSNTLWLETDRGWTGLLVEPDPHSFKELVTRHRKAWTTHSCFSIENYPKEETIVSFLPQEQPKDSKVKLPFLIPGVSHLLGVELDSKQYEKHNKNVGGSFTTVQCFPLASYLLALNVSTVDFLSLDIQGAEKKVLGSFPWDRINIRSMVVEIVNKHMFDHEFVALMKSKQFDLVASRGRDYIFVKQGDPLLKLYQDDIATKG